MNIKSKPSLVDKRLLEVYIPKSISSTLSSLTPTPMLKLSDLKIDRAKMSRISKNTKYAFSNFMGVFFILICFLGLYKWHKQFSYNRFLLQNIHLAGPNAYEPIKSYDFMEKNFKK